MPLRKGSKWIPQGMSGFLCGEEVQPEYPLEEQTKVYFYYNEEQ